MAAPISDPGYDGSNKRRGTPHSPRLAMAEAPSLSLARFEPEEFLGEGGFGAVWKVRDPLRPGRRFALKVLSTSGAGRDAAREAALDEFRLGARVRHPVVLETIEVGSLDQGTDEKARPYLLSEFFPGSPLTPTWRESELVPVAIDLLSALDAIHAAGMRHGDVQPRNILVQKESPTARPQVRLLDFGLATESVRGSSRQATAGTPLYLAPEVLRGATPDARADLYALGLVLYECLCGPIRRSLSDHLLRTRQGVFFQEIHTIDVGAPWDRLLQRLLDPEPDTRLQNGAEGIAFLQSVDGVRGGRRGPSWDPPFEAAYPVGRPEFFEAVASAIESLGSRRPQLSLLVVEGDGGLGRSRLLAEAEKSAFAAGVRGLTWGTLRSMVSAGNDEIPEGGNPWVEDACFLPGSESAGGTISTATAAATANRIAREILKERTALLIDDLHLLSPTDRQIVRMVVEKLRGGHQSAPETAPTFPPALVVSVSSGALDRVEFSSWWNRLSGLPWVTLVSLEPWSDEEISAYLDRCLPPARRLGEIETLLRRDTAGNPGRLRRYLRELFRTGELRLDQQVWVCDRGASRGLPLLPDDSALFSREWETLDSPLRDVLGICACWSDEGSPVPFRTFAAVFGEADAGLLLRQLTGLEALAPAGTTVRDDAGVRLSRSQRVWIRRRGGPGERQRWRHLLSEADVPACERVFQRLKLEDIPCAEVLKAAEGSEENGERVLAYYAQLAARTPEDRASAAGSLGARLHARGEFRRATPFLLLALRDAASARDRGRAAILLAEGAVSRRALDEAGELIEQARSLLPGDDPAWPRVGFVSAAIKYLSGQLDAAIGELRDSLAAFPGVMSLENLLACALLARGDRERAGELFRGILEREESDRSITSPCSVRTNFGRLLFLEGRLFEAAEMQRRAARDYEAAGQWYPAAVAYGNLGVALRRSGAYEEAVAAASESLRLYRELGDDSGVAVAEANLGILAYELGLPGTAWRRFEAAETTERGRKKIFGHVTFLESRALLALDLGEEEKLDHVLRLRRQAREDGGVDVTGQTLLLELRLLAAGRDADESTLVELVRGREFVETDAGFLTELALQSEFLERSASLAELAPRALRELDRLAGTSPRAAVLRDVARLGRSASEDAGGLESLAAVVEAFPARDARRRALARLVERLPDGTTRERARARLRLLLDEVLFDLSPDQRERYRLRPEIKEACQVAWSTDAETTMRRDRSQDVIRKVFHFNRDILRETRLQSLLRKIVDAAMELTGAQRGVLFMRKRGRLNIVAARGTDGDLPDPETQLSHTVVEQTIEEGVGRLATDAREEQALRSIASVKELGLRSVICVPLRAKRARVLGALYLDNAFEQGVFTSEDLELAESFCAQAALAWAAATRRGELAGVLTKLRGANRQLQNELRLTRRDSTRRSQQEEKRLEGMVGDSPVMRQLFHLVQVVAPTDIPVLIAGESGTGKELVARAIHSLSPRAAKPFVAENCGAVPPTLLESTLFGYVKGAFTGADRDSPGLFAMADGGTLFLDEIAEMPIELQTRLLRVLQAGEVRPLGASTSVKVDVRIVAATNRNVRQAMTEGAFREDLYYRLQGAEVFVPPLRDRSDDIPLIVEHFLQVLAKQSEPKKVSVEAMERLCRYPWPGNVRELENEVRRLVLLCSARVIQLEYLSQPIREGVPPDGTSATGELHEVRPLRTVEQEAILNAMKYYGGHRGKVAEGLGICRSTLYLKLKEMGYAQD